MTTAFSQQTTPSQTRPQSWSNTDEQMAGSDKKDLDAIVLSWQNSLIRRRDFTLLDAPGWLNDKIIGFYYEYLEEVKFSEHKNSVCFITPDVGQFIKLSDGPELGIFLEPLSLPEKQLVVLAVNNNPLADQSGGSHWSTLFFNRAANCFFHYDSFSTTNQIAARQCAAKLAPYLNTESSKPLKCIEEKCPQQTNGHDCGVYTLIFSEVITRQILSKPTSSQPNLSELVSRDSVSKWRPQTKELILTLADEQHKK